MEESSMTITLSMLVGRWFSEQNYPLWRVEDHQGEWNLRISRIRRPLSRDGMSLEPKIPALTVKNQEGVVVLANQTILPAANPQFLDKMKAYIDEIEANDKLARWIAGYEEAQKVPGTTEEHELP